MHFGFISRPEIQPFDSKGYKPFLNKGFCIFKRCNYYWIILINNLYM